MNTTTPTTTTKTKAKPATIDTTKLELEFEAARAACVAADRALEDARRLQTEAAEAADTAAASPGAYDIAAEAECIKLHARARIASKRVEILVAELAAVQARFNEVNRRHFEAIELRAKTLEGASLSGLTAIGRERGERVAQLFLDLQAEVYELPSLAQKVSGTRVELLHAARERNVTLPADVLGMSPEQIVEQLSRLIAHTVADVLRKHGKDRSLGGASVMPARVVELFQLIELVSVNPTPAATANTVGHVTHDVHRIPAPVSG